jgi:hypothetical protein
MKRQLILAGTILLFITGFTSCKKQAEGTKPLRTKMLGKWQVNKIEVTRYTASGAGVTTSTNYGSADYIDFKDNESDDFELGLGTQRSVGNFSSSIGNKLFLDFTEKDLDCDVNVITDKQFQFTGTVSGSNPKVTETYYLSR